MQWQTIYKISGLMFQNPKSPPEYLFLGVSWITNNYTGVQQMSMIFQTSPTLLIKLTCRGTASKMHIFENKFLDLWLIGDPRRENAIRNLCFSTKSGDPPVDCDTWKFWELEFEKYTIQRLLMMNGSSLMAQGSWLMPQGSCLKAHGSWPRNIWR